MRKMLWVLGVCTLALGVPIAASATSFDLSSCGEAGLAANCNNTDTGLTHLTYTVGSDTLGATGNDTLDLKLTPGVPGETGLGIFREAEHEVDSAGLITLDFSDLAGKGATSGTLTVSSLQTGEVGIVNDVNGIHTVTETDGTLLADVPIAFSETHPTVRLTATPGDVLAANAVAVVPAPPVTIPEPGPWLLVGTGLLGLAAMRLRNGR